MRYNFRRYCKNYQDIENYDKAKADDFIGWHCHHRKGIDTPAEELKALGLYYNRPASELIFLTLSEHSKLHQKGKPGYWKGKTGPNKGKKLSAEHKKKIGEAMKGHTVSAEARNKMSEARKGKPRPEETRNKISKAKKGNTATKDMHWYNNSKINIMAYECQDGFVPGRISWKK